MPGPMLGQGLRLPELWEGCEDAKLTRGTDSKGAVDTCEELCSRAAPGTLACGVMLQRVHAATGSRCSWYNLERR